MTEMERRGKALKAVEKLSAENSQIGTLALVLIQTIGGLREHTERIKRIESKLGIKPEDA